jgi:ATP-dependent Clp protease adaptor protein ClpS
MLTIHYKGKGLCGTYTAEIAETKVEHVVQYALENQHPLQCLMEKA